MNYPKHSKTPKAHDKTINLKDDFDSEFSTNSLVMNDRNYKNKGVMDDIQVLEAKIDVDNNHK